MNKNITQFFKKIKNDLTPKPKQSFLGLYLGIALFGVIIFLASLTDFCGAGVFGNDDCQRLDYIKRLQRTFEQYHDACGRYPVLPNATAIDFIPKWDVSFPDGCPKGANLGMFFYPDPIHHKPLSEYEPLMYCSTARVGLLKCSSSGESYAISFNIATERDNLSPGRHFATPAGIE